MFCICCNINAQSRNEIYDRFGIKEDVKKLDKYTSVLINRDKELSKIKGIKKLFVFALHDNFGKVELPCNDDFEMIFQSKIRYRQIDYWPLHTNRVIDGYTFLVTKDGRLLGYLDGDDFCKEYKDDESTRNLAKMILNDEITFACLLDGIDDFLILKQEKLYRVVMGTDTIHVLPYDKNLIHLN